MTTCVEYAQENELVAAAVAPTACFTGADTDLLTDPSTPPIPRAEDEEDDEALEALATQIEEAHRSVTRATTAVVELARDCGQLLLKTRERMSGKEWKEWVALNCSFSVRSAQDYVRIAEAFDKGVIDAAQHAAPSLRQVLANIRKSQAAKGGKEATAADWHEYPAELHRHLRAWDRARERFVRLTKLLAANPTSGTRFRELVRDSIADI